MLNLAILYEKIVAISFLVNPSDILSELNSTGRSGASLRPGITLTGKEALYPLYGIDATSSLDVLNSINKLFKWLFFSRAMASHCGGPGSIPGRDSFATSSLGWGRPLLVLFIVVTPT
jgi:hypothetical protein